MIEVIHICKNGHYIYGGGNVQFCRNGTNCYHKIVKGRNAHEYQNTGGLENFCRVCYDKGLDDNLRKHK